MSSKRSTGFTWRTVAWLGVACLLVIPFALLDVEAQTSPGVQGRKEIGRPGSQGQRSDWTAEAMAAMVEWLNRPENKRYGHQRVEWYPYADNAGRHYGNVPVEMVDSPNVLHFQGKGSIDTRSAFVRENLPSELKAANSLEAPGRKSKGDVYVIQMNPQAIAGKRSTEVRGMLSDAGLEPLRYIPNNGFLVRIANKGDLAALNRTDLIQYSSPLMVADKIAADVGFRPLMDAERAKSDTFRLVAEVMPGESSSDLSRSIERLGGEVLNTSTIGDTEFVTFDLRSSRLHQIAADPAVLTIEEAQDYMSMALAGSLMTEVGQFLNPIDFGDFIRPYRDAGVDGGGVYTGAVDWTDPNPGAALLIAPGDFSVAPQFIGIGDNGFSMDSPAFAHDNTHPCTNGACVGAGSDDGLAGVGSSHRKVEAYLRGGDFDGTADGDFLSCDAVSSGGRSHGTTVASVGAGNPSFGPLGLGRTYEDVDSLDLFVAFFNDSREDNLPLDGQAPGARLILFDLADTPPSSPPGCANNNQSDAVPGATPANRLADMVFRRDLNLANSTPHARGARVTLFSFGVPGFDDDITNGQGLYAAAGAGAIDTFLFQNRRVVHIQPVGNDGADEAGTDIDPFDGGANMVFDADDIQINNLATGKNLVTVGANSTADSVVRDQPANAREIISNTTSKGPATFGSLRIAPIVVAPGVDFVTAREGRFTDDYFISAAVVQSLDNENDADAANEVEDVVTQGSAGSSIAAGRVAGAAAQIRDYFAQGYYPSANAIAGDREGDVSGMLVKALLANSADFSSLGPLIASCPSRFCVEEGYGSIELSATLPIFNYRRERIPPRSGVLGPITNVPQALRVVDEYFDGGMRGGGADGSTTGIGVVQEGGSVSFDVFRRHGLDQFRATLAWYDAQGEMLVNDLDLTVISGDYDLVAPGVCNQGLPEECGFCTIAGNGLDASYFDAGGTNPYVRIYNGNTFLEHGGQMSTTAQCNPGTGALDANFPESNPDNRNAIEQVVLHYLGSPNVFGQTRSGGDNGFYRIRVDFPATGGSAVQAPNIPCVHGGLNNVIDSTVNAGDVLDTTWNGGATQIVRSGTASPLCQTTASGDDIQLVSPGVVGSAFALAVAGPIGTDRNNSTISFNRDVYTCSEDELTVRVADNSRCIGAGCGPRQSTPDFAVTANVKVEVIDPNGTVVDREDGLSFVTDAAIQGASSLRVGRDIHYTSAPRRVQNSKDTLGRDPIFNNGVIEVDNHDIIRGTYVDITPNVGALGDAPKPEDAIVEARVNCEPFLGPVLRNIGDDDNRRTLMVGGCDVGRLRNTRGDFFLDAGENVIYQVGFANMNRKQTLNLRATLSCNDPCDGVGAPDLPAPAGCNPTPGVNPCSFISIPTPTVELDEVPPNREGIASWVLVADETLAAVTEPTDLAVDLTVTFEQRGTEYGGELAAFSQTFREGLQADKETLRYNSDYPTGGVQASDYNRDGQIQTDGRGPGVSRRELATYQSWIGTSNNALATTACGGNPCIPWHFDTNNGGFTAGRTADSKETGAGCSVCWFYSTGGGCGWQTQNNGVPAASANLSKGTWHAGAAPTFFRDAGGGCPDYVVPSDLNTPPATEFINDYLRSPVLNKVNTGLDARGLPFDLRMEAYGWNNSLEVTDGSSNANSEVDADLDDESQVTLGDSYSYRIPFGTDGPLLGPAEGWETFGPLRDSDGTLSIAVTGDEAGVSEPYLSPGLFEGANPVGNIEADIQNRGEMPYPVIDINDAVFGFQSNIGTVGPNGLPIIHGICGASGVCSFGGDAKVGVKACAPAGPVADPNCAGEGTQLGHTSPWGPVRNVEVDLVVGENFDFRETGEGTRFAFEFGWLVVEDAVTSMGWTIDDAYFEWSESHGATQDANGPNACDNIASRPGANPNAEQCAVVSLERLTYHKCSTGIKAQVFDSTASATVGTLGCAMGEVPINARSNNITAQEEPEGETFCLAPVAGTPGLFEGVIKVSGLADSPGVLFVKTAGQENFNILVSYADPECDQDGDGELLENNFLDVDGDGIANLGADGVQADVSTTVFLSDGLLGASDDDNCFDGNPVGVDGTPADYFNPNTPFGTVADLYNPGIPQRDNNKGGTISSEDCPPAFVMVGGTAVANQHRNTDPPGNCAGGFCSGGPKAGLACTTNLQCERHGRSRINGQCDWDNDGKGDLCDNCPITSNNNQLDTDGDGVGDACENNDSDFGRTLGVTKLIPDFRQNSVDNCPTLYNPTQLPFGPGVPVGRGLVCDDAVDRDGDGIPENVDNCPNEGNPLDFGVSPPLASDTYNPQQVDTDGDGIGDRCDIEDFDGDTVINEVDNCPTIYNPPDPFFIIQTDSDLDGFGDDRTGIDSQPGVQNYCDPDNDDDNGNNVPDDLLQIATEMNCNFTQFGIINADSPQGVVGSLSMGPVSIMDDGTADGGIPDGAADPGEYTQMTFAVANGTVDRQTGAPRPITNLSVGVRKTTPVVGCMVIDTHFVGTLAAGGGAAMPPLGDPAALAFIVDPANPGPGQSSGAELAEASFLLTAQGDDLEGISPDQEFKMLVDIDVGADQPLVPVGAYGASYDPDCIGSAGYLCEDFDTNRNATPGYQWTRLTIGQCLNPITLAVDPLCVLGDPNDDVLGYTQNTGAVPAGTGGDQCAGDVVFAQPTCSKPVAEENDWHLHSPSEGPGTSYDPPNRPGIGAPDGGKAHSGFRSMHMGRHTDPGDTLGDTYRFRQVSAFVLDPAPILDPNGDILVEGSLNLGPASTMEFWHMIQLTDDDAFGFLNTGTTFSGTQVHISTQGLTGDFARWERLTPAANSYNSVMQEQVSICSFDPTDDSFPAGGNETMCNASPMWSDIGEIIGTDASCNVDTDGNDSDQLDCGEINPFIVGNPADQGVLGNTERSSGASGHIGPYAGTGPGTSTDGVWARSAFDLSPFAGRKARLRWIGNMGGGWSFGTSRSFLEPQSPPPYQYYEEDDGWWIDDIKLTDLRIGPKPIVPDVGTGNSTCAIGDSCGTVDIIVANSVPLALDECLGPVALLTLDTFGQPIALDARQSFASGPPCEQGELLYEWTEIDSADCSTAVDVLSPMSPAARILVAPTQSTKYKVSVMCSTDPGCSAEQVVQIAPNQADGGDIGALGVGDLDVDYGANPISQTPASTRVYWTQTSTSPPGMPGYDVHRVERGNCGGGFTCLGIDPYETADGSVGVFGGDIAALAPAAPNGACWVADVAFPGVGNDAQALDTGNPPAGNAYFYQVGTGIEINFASTAGVAGGTRTLLGSSADPADAGRNNFGNCCSAAGNASCGPVSPSPVLP